MFAACVRIVEASPMLAGTAKITANKIEFTSTGTTIVALPADYSGAAGANPSLTELPRSPRSLKAPPSYRKA